jgi:hypothetical protein
MNVNNFLFREKINFKTDTALHNKEEGANIFKDGKLLLVNVKSREHSLFHKIKIGR